MLFLRNGHNILYLCWGKDADALVDAWIQCQHQDPDQKQACGRQGSLHFREGEHGSWGGDGQTQQS